ncbi:MAG: hypothetical protein PHD58_09500 [Anaerolineales bacterium]|nr:hypothetical protein [Anaerolineales bacterium]
MKKRINALLAILILAAPLAGCLQLPRVNQGLTWSPADVRLLDPADASHPGQDLLALYARIQTPPDSEAELLVRIDFLDLQPAPEQDIYLLLDYLPGGERTLPLDSTADVAWEALLSLPAQGELLFTTKQNLLPASRSASVYRDPRVDSVTFRITGAGLPQRYAGFRLQLYVTAPGSRQIADATLPFAADAPSPRPAPVALAFWNAFPADTPVQALRRWDGAHSGPYGGRHGLFNLLKSARTHSVPLTLLDLKFPTSLAALDFSGGLQLVREMANASLLTLPEVAPVFPIERPSDLPEWVVAGAARQSRQLARRYGFEASRALFLPALPVGGEYPAHDLVFIPAPPRDPPVSELLRYQGKRVLPIPIGQPGKVEKVQATPAGASIELRRQLANFAYQLNLAGAPASSQVFLLGGDLPRSTWGDPQASRSTLDYLQAHPWLALVDLSAWAYGEKAQPIETPDLERTSLTRSQVKSLEWLAEAGDSPFTGTAWQALTHLTAPVATSSEELAALRNDYWLMLDDLRLIDTWVEKQGLPSGCQASGGNPRQQRCVLASPNMLLLLDPQEGSLLYAFAYANGKVIQLIGPTSQLSSGQSDPGAWRPGAGYRADPSVFPGAFADEGGPYRWTIAGNRITFEGDGAVQRKTYTLDEDGLRVAYLTRQPALVSLPLILEASRPLEPRWAYAYRIQVTEGKLIWGINDGARILVCSNASLRFSSFLEGRPAAGTTEDPNAEILPGAFLPFPLGLAEVAGEGAFSIEVKLLP